MAHPPPPENESFQGHPSVLRGFSRGIPMVIAYAVLAVYVVYYSALMITGVAVSLGVMWGVEWRQSLGKCNREREEWESEARGGNACEKAEGGRSEQTRRCELE
ncbi:hypothetical protein BDZ91DRAFT_795538 [Kalaharituber pfeilii]|nr:hypothetical protein BDZ91DRAFT_795538 [Kalaharituber pfeilii]